MKKTYASGVLSETRHFFYSVAWQVLEERVDDSALAERQFVWGVRYVDDLVLRDRDTDSDGTMDERLYAMQDANFNVTAIADATGVVVERNAYDAYGVPSVLTPGFWARSSSLYRWETLYAGYSWDGECGLFQVRNRGYNPRTGCLLQRDPLGFAAGDTDLYRYVGNRPTNEVDPSGQSTSGAVGGAVEGGAIGFLWGAGGALLVGGAVILSGGTLLIPLAGVALVGGAVGGATGAYYGSAVGSQQPDFLSGAAAVADPEISIPLGALAFCEGAAIALLFVGRPGGVCEIRLAACLLTGLAGLPDFWENRNILNPGRCMECYRQCRANRGLPRGRAGWRWPWPGRGRPLPGSPKEFIHCDYWNDSFRQPGDWRPHTWRGRGI